MSNMQEWINKAEVLAEALPYIRNFAGKTIVIKYGGQAMISDKLKEQIITDIILMKYIGINPIVVHGGGREINRLLERVGLNAQFAGGLRVTDSVAIELVEMALVGKVNKELVALINRLGGKAVGISGKDANLLVGTRRTPERVQENGKEELVDLGFVGDITSVHPEVVISLSSQGYIPVIAPVAASLEGETLNINADHVAGEMAAALQAEKLILLTDVEGIMAEEGNTDTLISSLPRQQAIDMIESGKIQRGMIPKVEACFRALDNEVARTHIVDGRIPHSMLLEIFTDHGVGTMVTS